MSADSEVTGGYIALDGERYFRITNSHRMEDFFMSLVGAGDHWMFVSSNGALTAGRRNADNALFPYASDDKISVGRGETGSLTLVRIGERLWEPLAPHSAGTDCIRRNLYKTPLGNKLVFEEINESLQLGFRYRWTFSRRFGFVRSCRLENFGKKTCSLSLLDGVQNVLPYGVGSEFMMRFSNLANAYKKSELLADSGLGLFYLSSIPTDRAEPSEGLKATTIWQTGLTPDALLLSAGQVPAFREGAELYGEAEARGKAGAYLVGQTLQLASGESVEWHLVAELEQDHTTVVALDDWLQRTADPAAEVADDVRDSEEEFLRILSSSDGIQLGSNERLCNRHLSNTVFNVMRGGVPLEGYRVHAGDFASFVANFNREARRRHEGFFAGLPELLETADLRARIAKQNDADLTRLGLEYLPLAFSRRHGDPTRPWNHFSIELKSDGGHTNLNYQGNWRDLFQNWEALLQSFPAFSPGMVCRFVNATTADGYNPYRVTRDGFEWEEPSPEDPWANIGYWGDHQIIYLLKLLEWTRAFYPHGLDGLLNETVFTHANIPYRIKDYEEIVKDVRDTIEFDAERSKRIARRVAEIGADGKLLCDQAGSIHYVTLAEKLLTLTLAKLSNFIPDGGIWLNTQRPEWNDANNALVGNGLSMVTTCYLYRWCTFLHDWLAEQSGVSFRVSGEVAAFFRRVTGILGEHADSLPGPRDGSTRLQIVEALSRAGSEYRNGIYDEGLSGRHEKLSRADILALLAAAGRHLGETIRSNRRKDGLYHSYNLLDLRDEVVEIEPLDEMLEGQVAVLSAGLLDADEAVAVLDALRGSRLYREDQDSYILYPDRQLPRFLEKNRLGDDLGAASPLLQRLFEDGDGRIVTRDVRGGVHFNGAFRNSADLRAALDGLGDDYEGEVSAHGDELVQAFDDLFGHRQFTGRSGTFFAYEGLGSIYWHMVSKLALAAAENLFRAIEAGKPQGTIDSLSAHYQSIKHGIGAEKSPADYGAFPSDPYSHTPEGAGVKQPGMTGQVKEDLLARFAELGVHIDGGSLSFRLDLFDRAELLEEAGELAFFDLSGVHRVVSVPQGGFAFTLFQVPVIYRPGERNVIELYDSSGNTHVIEGLRIDPQTSENLFSRSGAFERITCHFQELPSS